MFQSSFINFLLYTLCLYICYQLFVRELRKKVEEENKKEGIINIFLHFELNSTLIQLYSRYGKFNLILTWLCIMHLKKEDTYIYSNQLYMNICTFWHRKKKKKKKSGNIHKIFGFYQHFLYTYYLRNMETTYYLSNPILHNYLP